MLLEGKHGLIVGIANRRSLAWGIAQSLAREGARLAVTYQGERLERNVRELAKDLKDPLKIDMVGIDDVFGRSGPSWQLMQDFGLTGEHIAQRALVLLGKRSAKK